MRMKTFKAFYTSTMTDEQFKVARGRFLDQDAPAFYTVGRYVSEYEVADNKECYPDDEVKACRSLDDMMKSHGAEDGEEVILIWGECV